MFKLNLGINECSNAEYHSDTEYLSSSDYKLILEDPAEFYKKKYLSAKVQEEKSYLINGSYVHSTILEPHLTASEFVVYPEVRKQGAAFEAFALQHPGKQILNKGQHQACLRMIAGYKRLPAAVNLIKGGFAEHTVCVDFNGIKTKVRGDYVNIEEGYIVDIKTSAYDVDLDSFKATIEHWSYDLSAALYAKVLERFYGKKFTFYWLVISSKTGECQLYKLSEKTRLKGELEIAEAQKIYKECLKSGLWISKEKNVIVEPVVKNDYEILEI